jgi:hypothetical protein
MTRVLHWLALVIIPIWWIFHLLWNPAVVDFMASISYRLQSPIVSSMTLLEARNRALKIATNGSGDERDVVFTPNEISHLNDVATLYIPVARVLNFLCVCAWILLLATLLKQHSILPSLKLAAVTYSVFVVILILCSLFFSLFFTQFHTSLFPQGNWQFPEDSLLIQSFPELFWQLMVGLITLLCAGVATLYALLSLLGRSSSSNDESTR